MQMKRESEELKMMIGKKCLSCYDQIRNEDGKRDKFIRKTIDQYVRVCAVVIDFQKSKFKF